MGDDCTAPNAARLTYRDDERISQFLSTVSSYVPCMKNTVWAVYCLHEMIAYIEFDEVGGTSFTVCGDNKYVKDLAGGKIFCRYYTSRSGFHLRFNSDGTKKPRLSKEEIKAKAKKDNAAANKRL